MLVCSVGVEQRAHLVSTPRWVKVHISMIAQKTAIKSSRRGYKFFFKIFFSTKNCRKTSIFGRKFDKSSVPAELDRLRNARNSAKRPQ